MPFQEYPKALYQSADVYRIAADADAEDALRADGFGDHADLDAGTEPTASTEASTTASRPRGAAKAK